MFLNRISIKHKLLIMLTLPVIGVLFFSMEGISRKYEIRRDIETLKDKTTYIEKVSDLIQEIHAERIFASGFLGSQGQFFEKNFVSQQANTDRALQDLLEFTASLPPLPIPQKFSLFSNVMRMLKEIQKHRSALLRFQGSFDEIVAFYTRLNQLLIENIAPSASDLNFPELKENRTALTSFLIMQELHGETAAILSYAYALGRMDEHPYRQLEALLLKQEAQREIFFSLFAEGHSYQEELQQKPFMKEFDRMQMLALQNVAPKPLEIDPEAWYLQEKQVRNFFQVIETHLLDDRKAQIEHLRENSLNDYLKYLGIFVIGGICTLFVGMLIINNIKQRILLMFHALKEISEGNFDPQTSSALQHWNNQDELSVLSETITEMSNKLAALFSESKGVTVQLFEANLKLEKAVSRHKITEQELREGQRTIMTLMGNLNGLVYRCRNEAEWTMRFVSEGCFKLTGYHPSQLIENFAVSFGSLIHNDDQAFIWSEVQKALETKKHFQCIYRIVTASGGMKWVWNQGCGVFDTQGKLLCIEGFITDISELKNAEEAIQRSYRELERISKTFQLFVPRQFLHRIQNSEDQIIPGEVQEEKLTILFSDIRSYTMLCEQMSSKDMVEFLNTYLHLMEPCITANHGFIDKFIGDAIMALFELESSSVQAVQAAVDMQQAINTYNETRDGTHRPFIKVGMGINTGTVMIGALGSANRLESTVIGDHVNLTSRLEGLTKKYKVRILISQYTYDALPEDHFLIREIDTVKVHGKSNATRIYEVYDADREDIREKKEQTKSMFSKGIQTYKVGKFQEALAYFLKVLDVHSSDRVALEYVKRCHYYSKYPPSLEEWGGVTPENYQFIDQSIRRHWPRHVLNTPANLFKTHSDLQLAGIIRNISEGGIQLDTSHNLQLGDTVNVEIFLPQKTLDDFLDQKPHKVWCQVVWQIPNDVFNQRPYWETGLEFVVISDDDEQRLKQILGPIKVKTPELT
ncbi:adenylate/guanylate cyclase domain-containing protein [Deltaproteobacteria bacterium TL4]